MTTGSKVIDLRTKYTYQNPTGPVNLANGPYMEKSWNGGDLPKVPPAYVKTYTLGESRYLSKKWVKLKNGKKSWYYYRKPKLYVKRKRVRPSKFDRRLQPHVYTMTGVSFVDGEVILPKYQGNTDPFRYNAIGYLFQPEEPGAFTSQDELAILGRIRERALGSSFDPAVFLSQGHQALGMITNAATRIYGAWRAARKGQLNKAARILTRGTSREKLLDKRNPASNWLELQYGWLPLLGDAAEGAEWLAETLGSPRLTVRGSYTVRLPLHNPSNWPGVNGWAIDGEVKRSCRFVVTLKEPPRTDLSLGLVDPWSVVWENVPYSFVVDWFVPVGDWLAARSLVNSLKVQTVVKTYRRTYHQKGFYLNRKKFPNGGYGAGLSAEKRWISLDRKVSSSLDLPALRAKDLTSVPSWRRAANAVSLLIGISHQRQRAIGRKAVQDHLMV